MILVLAGVVAGILLLCGVIVLIGGWYLRHDDDV